MQEVPSPKIMGTHNERGGYFKKNNSFSLIETTKELLAAPLEPAQAVNLVRNLRPHQHEGRGQVRQRSCGCLTYIVLTTYIIANETNQVSPQSLENWRLETSAFRFGLSSAKSRSNLSTAV